MQCDVCAIKKVIYQYADFLDRGDLQGLARMFSHGRIVTSDATGQEHQITGEDAVYAMYRSFTRLYEDNGTPHTLHMTSNVIVEVDATGVTASAQAYAVVFQSADDFPLQPIIGVRYADKFEKAGQVWRFSERNIDPHLYGDLGRHLLQPL